MHVQIINFNLRNLGHDDYLAFCDEVAPAFAALPGLVSKTWLADPATNTYGGVYFWSDLDALKAFVASDLFRSVGNHPNLENIKSSSFETLPAPGEVTRSLGAVAA